MSEKSLHINDLFWTFQGEGFHAGRRALFVRMPFCNLACPWCDTTFDSFQRWTEEGFVAFALSEPSRFAVITGGEPMLHKQTPRIIAKLASLGFEVACETNGTSKILSGIDFATVSPKRVSLNVRVPGGLERMPAYYIDRQAMLLADEFKYVVDAEFDFSVLDRHDVKDGRRYSLSPEFGDWKGSLARIFAFIEKNPGWRISLQTHKWMDVK